MSSGIATIRTAVRSFTDHKEGRPARETISLAVSEAKKRGIFFDANGRAVAPWLPNVKGHRYQNGKLIPRFAHRNAQRYNPPPVL